MTMPMCDICCPSSLGRPSSGQGEAQFLRVFPWLCLSNPGSSGVQEVQYCRTCKLSLLVNVVRIFTKYLVNVWKFGHKICFSENVKNSQCLILNVKNLVTMTYVFFAFSLIFLLSLSLLLSLAMTIFFLALFFSLSFTPSVSLPLFLLPSFPLCLPLMLLEFFWKYLSYTRYCARSSHPLHSMTSHSIIFTSILCTFFYFSLLNLVYLVICFDFINMLNFNNILFHYKNNTLIAKNLEKTHRKNKTKTRNPLIHRQSLLILCHFPFQILSVSIISLYLYVHVYLYVWVCVRMCTFIYNMSVYICVHVYLSFHLYISVYVYVQTSVYREQERLSFSFYEDYTLMG